MAIYVDNLQNLGWVLRGHKVQSCHMIADTLAELHQIAAAIGMQRNWYQPRSFPHYDLTASRRAAAVLRGAIELPMRTFVKVKWAIAATPDYLDVPGIRTADVTVLDVLTAYYAEQATMPHDEAVPMHPTVLAMVEGRLKC